MNTKEATARKEEKLAELLREAAGHPMMKAILAEKAAAILAMRTEAAGKIEALKKERDEVLPKLRAYRDGKEENYKRAKAALDTAGSEYQTARAALSSESQSFDIAIRRQEQILFESADPAHDEAITFFREKLDWLRSPGRISSNRLGSERNLFTEEITFKTESNVDAIIAAMGYCRDAVKELENLKLSPALDIQKIEDMKKGIPDIGIFSESTGERSMEKINTNPRSLLPSDSQMDWEIGRLNEKFKKVMGK